MKSQPNQPIVVTKLWPRTKQGNVLKVVSESKSMAKNLS